MKSFDLCVLVLCLVVTMCGCVKERRRDCPCRLLLDMSQVDTTSIPELKVSVRCSDGRISQEVRDAELFTEDMMLLVPRGSCTVNVYSGEAGMASCGNGLDIPYGEECPAVYMYTALLDTDCEILRRSVVMRKNHCTMSISVEDSEHFPFSLAVRGEVSGYDFKGAPRPGQFYCSSAPMQESIWEISVPRQLDHSLILEVSDGTDVLKNFALGEYIKASGYDWNAPDLEDIAIGIDYTRTKLVIAVKGWDEVYEFDVVI